MAPDHFAAHGRDRCTSPYRSPACCAIILALPAVSAIQQAAQACRMIWGRDRAADPVCRDPRCRHRRQLGARIDVRLIEDERLSVMASAVRADPRPIPHCRSSNMSVARSCRAMGLFPCASAPTSPAAKRLAATAPLAVSSPLRFASLLASQETAAAPSFACAAGLPAAAPSCCCPSCASRPQ